MKRFSLDKVFFLSSCNQAHLSSPLQTNVNLANFVELLCSPVVRLFVARWSLDEDTSLIFTVELLSMTQWEEMVSSSSSNFSLWDSIDRSDGEANLLDEHKSNLKNSKRKISFFFHLSINRFCKRKDNFRAIVFIFFEIKFHLKWNSLNWHRARWMKVLCLSKSFLIFLFFSSNEIWRKVFALS